MTIQSRRLAITALTLCLSMSVSRAGAADDLYRQQRIAPTSGAMAVDVLAARPLGLVATVLGTGLFVVSLPFSALGGNVDDAAQSLVVTPARYTFTRPLGEFNGYD